MTTPRPNVVLICVDQWRGDCLSCAGHPVVETPYLDGLAESGARFTNAYSASPTCVPARMSLMTGLTAATHGRVGYSDGVPFDVEVTLPGEFSHAGYQTQAIGKMHYWPERGRIGFDDVILHDGYLHHSRGRERAAAFYDDYLVWLRSHAGESSVADYLEDGIHCNSVVARPWDKAESLHPTNWVVTEATRWLYRRDPTVPFFLYLSFHRPHPPYDPPQWAFDQYADAPSLTPPVGDWTDEYAALRNDRRPDSHVAVYDQRTMDRAQAGYYGNMSHIDQQVERFLEILNEFGVAEDTYICFTSDHGEMLGDHNMWRKGYPYEGSAHVPFLLTGPTISSGVVAHEIIELRDVMPTLLDCAGLDIPESVEGRSVVPLTRPRAEEYPVAWRPFIHGEHTVLEQSLQWLRTGRWKYVWLSGSGREQLFDVEADPTELRNRAADPVCADTLRSCRQRLIAELDGREEGFVSDGALVAGRAVTTTLAGAGKRPRGVGHFIPKRPQSAP